MKRLQFFALLLGGERNCFLCAPSVRPSPPVSHWYSSSPPIGCWPLSSASDWMALTRREVGSDGKLQVNTPGQKMFWVFIKIISAQLECVKWEYFRSMSLSLSIMSISILQLFPQTIRRMRWLWCIRLKRQIQIKGLNHSIHAIWKEYWMIILYIGWLFVCKLVRAVALILNI